MSGWSDALAQFEAHLKQSGLARDTVVAYLRDLRSFSLWLAVRAGQEVPPGIFSAGEVEAYVQYLSGTLGRSPASINRCLQSLRKFGRFGLMSGLFGSDPVQGVRLLERPVHSAPQILTELEVERLVKAAEARRSRTPARDYAILQLLLQTGIRASELVHLQLADIELSDYHGTLIVRSREKRPERRIPLNQAVRRALLAYLEQPRPAGVSHLFWSREDKRLSVRSVQQIVAKLGRAANLVISVKTLRDTYARSLWRDTGDLGLLTERLGLRRPETALKYISPLSIAGSAMEVLVVEGRSPSTIG